MLRLTREVRFSLLPPPKSAGKVLNSWAGWPGAALIAPYVVLRATVSGKPHPITGYLCNITFIDRLLRDRAIPHLQKGWTLRARQGSPAAPAVLSLWELLQSEGPDQSTLEQLELCTTPYQRFATGREIHPMITMTESFEFAASHRLYCPELAEEENLRTFGKCSNPNGHGHNYVLEVTVAGGADPQTGQIIDHQAFQRTVKQRVVDRFDHKHLNTDCPEFEELNPTVESITRVIWDLLEGRFGPARLERVRVYETPKTCAEYAGE